MKIYDKKDFRYIISFFIFFFIIWFYILAYLSTISIFLLIPSLVLIIIFLFKGKIVWLFTSLVLMFIYFLLFNFLPSKECGLSDWKNQYPIEVRSNQPCRCFGVITYHDNMQVKRCIGKMR